MVTIHVGWVIYACSMKIAVNGIEPHTFVSKAPALLLEATMTLQKHGTIKFFICEIDA